MPCFALVSYFGLVSISIGFSSFGKFFFGITYPCMLCYALDSLYSLIRQYEITRWSQETRETKIEKGKWFEQGRVHHF